MSAILMDSLVISSQIVFLNHAFAEIRKRFLPPKFLHFVVCIKEMLLPVLVLFAITAAGVVPCGGPKRSPRTSSKMQIIFPFGPLRSVREL